jgi:hypothetical protein
MLQLHRSLTLGPETWITLGAEYRQMAERSDERSSDASGYGLTLGAAQAFTTGALLVRVDGEVGALYHPLAGTVPQGRADVGLWFGPWLGALEVATEAAYPELFTLTALRPSTGEAPLTARKVGLTLAGPIGLLDAGLTWSHTRLSDGNASLTLQAYARYPIGSRLFAVYSGTGTAFDRRSFRYWDPARYVAQGAGVEYARRQARGLSFATRVLPNMAWSEEAPIVRPITFGAPPTRGELVQRSAMQVSAGAEVEYRAPTWETAGAVDYGRGRAGDYQRLGASITVRIIR